MKHYYGRKFQIGTHGFPKINEVQILMVQNLACYCREDIDRLRNTDPCNTLVNFIFASNVLYF